MLAEEIITIISEAKMPTSKIVYNWALLDREGLANYFWSFYPEITNQTISVKDFHKRLANHIKKIIPIIVKRATSQEVDKTWVWVGGTYYSDWDKARKKSIELLLVYNPTDTKINMSRRRFHRMCYAMADTLLHEIIHMRQYRRRKFKFLPDYPSTANKQKIREEQEYLGNSDEIDAYSFNIACELYEKFYGDYNEIINYLNENQKGKRRRYNGWRMYLKAFEHDHNHPIIQRVKKKVVRYLPQATIGKPYKNSDWLNR